MFGAILKERSRATERVKATAREKREIGKRLRDTRRGLKRESGERGSEKERERETEEERERNR